MNDEETQCKGSEQSDLEEVEAGNKSNRFISAFFASIVLLLALLVTPFFVIFPVVAIVTGIDIGQGKTTVGVDCFLVLIAAIVTCLDIWILRRFLCAEVYWKADSEGLTVYKIFTRRRVLWNDIREVSLTKSRFVGQVYRFNTQKGVFSVSSKITEHTRLEASVKYHLRRHNVLCDGNILGLQEARVNPNDPMYLPELEVVDAWGPHQEISGFISLVFIFLFGCMFAGLMYRIWNLPRTWIGNTASALLATALTLFYFNLVKRILLEEQYIRSDSSGLTVKRALTKSFISWPDVEDAWIAQSPGGKPRLTLKHKGKVFSMSGTATLNLGLAASIWQYLRQYGKAYNVHITESLRSLWNEIPESVPSEMGWKPVDAPTGFNIKSIELRNDQISVDINGKLKTIAFLDVTTACWLRVPAGVFLYIDSNKKHKSITIPVMLPNADYVRLLLAIVRRLRTAGVPQWLEVPQELLSALDK
ncbi:MAG: hypothetical protein ABFD64_04570 [Armatimonadota bacterium]